MSRSKIKSDVHGFYLKKDGYIFRPVFPPGYETKNPTVPLEEGTKVRVTYNGSGSYARINIDGTILFWMKHGTYIIPQGDDIKHLKSETVILPTDASKRN